MATGGSSGPVIIAGKPGESRLLKALRFTDSNLQMPPSGKLPDSIISDFEDWILSGAPDPRTAPSAGETNAALKGMSIESGRKWWAFQPIAELIAPKVSNISWIGNKIDSFVLAKLDAKNITPSTKADSER